MFFSCLVVVAAGAFVLSLQSPFISRESKIFFAAWLVISVLVIVAIWVRHHKIIERMLLEPTLHDINNQFDQIHPLSV